MVDFRHCLTTPDGPGRFTGRKGTPRRLTRVTSSSLTRRNTVLLGQLSCLNNVVGHIFTVTSKIRLALQQRFDAGSFEAYRQSLREPIAIGLTPQRRGPARVATPGSVPQRGGHVIGINADRGTRRGLILGGMVTAAIHASQDTIARPTTARTTGRIPGHTEIFFYHHELSGGAVNRFIVRVRSFGVVKYACDVRSSHCDKNDSYLQYTGLDLRGSSVWTLRRAMAAESFSGRVLSPDSDQRTPANPRESHRRQQRDPNSSCSTGGGFCPVPESPQAAGADGDRGAGSRRHACPQTARSYAAVQAPGDQPLSIPP